MLGNLENDVSTSIAILDRLPATGKAREIAPTWDRSAGEIVLSVDGSSFYTAADDLGEHRLFNIDIASGKATVVAEGGSIGSPVIAGTTLAYTKNSLKSGDQIVVAGADGSSPREITRWVLASKPPSSASAAAGISASESVGVLAPSIR